MTDKHAAEANDFWVKLWGVRGTVPCPGPGTLRYGGNTSCIEVRCGGQRLIFDAGTGLRTLGRSLLEDPKESNADGFNASIFLTHTHLDHISGLPFFTLAYRPNNCVRFWAGHLGPHGRRIHEVLGDLMQPPFFPVPIDIMHACVSFTDFDAGDVLMPAPDVTLRTTLMNHPGGATGYRIDYAGKSICYVTDTEHKVGSLDRSVLDMIDGADIVIYDATYTDEEYPRYEGWGHSTWQQGVKLCKEANAKKLVTFHHDPDHDDDFLDGIALELDRAMPGAVVGKEGLVLTP